MEKDNKILLGAILIILITLVSFNFGDITGKVVKEGTVVSISPATVTAGDYITVYVKPGSKGVESSAYFYRIDGTRIPATVKLCGESRCTKETTIRYKLTDSWDNNADWAYGITSKGYYVKVQDWKVESYKTASFVVNRRYEAAGPAEHL